MGKYRPCLEESDPAGRRGETQWSATQMNVETLTVPELLLLHTRIGEELRKRGVTRSANNPTGDLSEYLFCKAFGWKQAANSHANIDAVAEDGTRYQVKGRRIMQFNKSRQLSAIRD